MNDFENLYLYELSPEGIETVKSGAARISAGGIIRKGDSKKGFIELARPATMSVADFQSLFEEKSHALETDEHLKKLDARLRLSEEGTKAIKDVVWLNNAAIQRIYTFTQAGFQKTLYGIESTIHQLSAFEEYVRQRDSSQLLQETHKYINWMKTDEGLLRSKIYSVTNGTIAEHLDTIQALIIRLLANIENRTGDVYISIQILVQLLPPFANLVGKYSSLFFYENDRQLMPGNYRGWIKTISDVSTSKSLKDLILYYMNIYTTMPFRDAVMLSKAISTGISRFPGNAKFEREYIKNHSKEEYLALPDQIRQKYKENEYFLFGQNALFFLDEGINPQIQGE